MNILNLKYFVAVAVSGSFSEAAETMFSTQSTVSKQISSLEKDLNVQLFDRSRRQIALTVQGKSVLKHAQVIMDDYNNMLRELADLQEYDDSTVCVASTPVMMPYNILNLLANFKAANPHLKMSVEEFDDQDILRHLRDGLCELAFVRGEDVDEEIYEKITICTDRIGAVMSQKHPLAQRSEISLAELAKENFLLLNKGSPLFHQCIAACNKAGFSPNIIYTGNRMTNLFNILAKGTGGGEVGLMLEKAAATTARDACCIGTVFVPLVENVTTDVSVLKIRHRHCNLATTSMWEYIKKNVSVPKNTNKYGV